MSPAPSTATKLVNVATKIGVGDSTRFLSKQKGLIDAAHRAWRVHRRVVHRQVRADRSARRRRTGSTGLHVYTFNAVAETEAWRQDWLRRLED